MGTRYCEKRDCKKRREGAGHSWREYARRKYSRKRTRTRKDLWTRTGEKKFSGNAAWFEGY